MTRLCATWRQTPVVVPMLSGCQTAANKYRYAFHEARYVVIYAYSQSNGLWDIRIFLGLIPKESQCTKYLDLIKFYDPTLMISFLFFSCISNKDNGCLTFPCILYGKPWRCIEGVEVNVHSISTDALKSCMCMWNRSWLKSTLKQAISGLTTLHYLWHHRCRTLNISNGKARNSHIRPQSKRPIYLSDIYHNLSPFLVSKYKFSKILSVNNLKCWQNNKILITMKRYFLIKALYAYLMFLESL